MTAAIKSVHNSLVQHSEALQAALVEPELAHLTLMVTALDTEKDVQRAEAAMGSFADQLALDDAWLEPMALSLEGLSHFRHQVQVARCAAKNAYSSQPDKQHNAALLTGRTAAQMQRWRLRQSMLLRLVCLRTRVELCLACTGIILGNQQGRTACSAPGLCSSSQGSYASIRWDLAANALIGSELQLQRRKADM